METYKKYLIEEKELPQHIQKLLKQIQEKQKELRDYGLKVVIEKTPSFKPYYSNTFNKLMLKRKD